MIIFIRFSTTKALLCFFLFPIIIYVFIALEEYNKPFTEPMFWTMTNVRPQNVQYPQFIRVRIT